MRFLAWLILGCILKAASMAAAACLFQKDGFSSSAGTGQHLSVPACQHPHPWGTCIPGVPTSLGHPHPWGTCSPGIPMLGPSLTWTEWVRMLFGVGKGHVGLHPLPGLRVLGQRRRGQQKGT